MGDPIELGLNDSGAVVAAPLTVEDAKVSAAGAAVILWVTIVACSAFPALVVRRTLDRSRDRAWERELHLLAYNDDGWANRHI